MKNKKNRFFLFLAWVFIFLGLLILIGYLILLGNSEWNFWSQEKIDVERTGAFGDYVGGVVGTLFSLSGFIFLYVTLKEQRLSFSRERLENNYFEMIKLHRDNVSELSFSYYPFKGGDKQTAEKRKVFKIIYDQFVEAYTELQHLFINKVNEEIYQEKYLETLKSNKEILNRNIKLDDYAKMDIIYLIIFFGVGSSGFNTIQEILKYKYKKEFLNLVLIHASLKPKKEEPQWEDWSFINADIKNKNDVLNDLFLYRLGQFDKLETYVPINDGHYQYKVVFYNNNYEKYYGGHQFRLGHYYRHLFQCVNYIDDNMSLSYAEKKSYMRLLRVQLSNYEQVCFFLNSLSHLGRDWEFEYKKGPDRNVPFEKQLLTKYNLIRNLPIDEALNGITFTRYYPNIWYEAIEGVSLDDRILFEKKYINKNRVFNYLKEKISL